MFGSCNKEDESNIKFVSYVVLIYCYLHYNDGGPGRNLVNAIGTFKTSLNRLRTIASVISEIKFELWTCCLATIFRVLKLVSFFLLSSLYSSQSRLTLPWMFFQFGTLRKFPNFRYQRLDRSWRGLKEITLQLWHLAAETQPKSATCDPNQRLAPIIILHSISLIIFTNWSTATASVFFRNQCSHPIIPGTLSCKLISAHECFRRPAFGDSEVAQEIQNVSIVSPHHISIRKLGGMPVV